MKRGSKLIILASILVLCCILTVIVLHTEEKKEEIKNADTTILALPTDTVTALSWSYEETELAFHKGEEAWLYDGDEAFPVDTEKVEKLLADFEDFGAAFIIQNAEDLSQYGLDKPVCSISITAGETEHTIALGAFSKMDSQRYVSLGDGNVYLVKTDPYDDFAVTLEDMILDDVLPKFGTVTAIRFAGEQNYEITRLDENTYSVCPEDEYFVSADGKMLPLDTDKVESYLSAISGMSRVKYVSYNLTEEERTAWGLDDPQLSISIDYVSKDADGNETNETFVLHLGRDAAETEQKAEIIEEQGESNLIITAYIQIGDSPIIYEVSDSTCTKLLAAGYNDLRHSEMLTMDFEQVASIDAILDGETYTITSELPESGSRKFYYQGEELELTDLRVKLQKLAATEFADAQPEKMEEARFVFHLENENAEQVELVLYRYDGSSCLAVVDGETVALVPRADTINAIEAVNVFALN